MAVDTYVVDAVTGKATILKDPDATLDYSFDWTAWLLAISDTISSKSFIVVAPIVIVSQSVVGGICTVFLSGGVVGTTYPVVNRIVTAGGRTEDRTIYLKIKDR